MIFLFASPLNPKQRASSNTSNVFIAKAKLLDRQGIYAVGAFCSLHQRFSMPVATRTETPDGRFRFHFPAKFHSEVLRRRNIAPTEDGDLLNR